MINKLISQILPHMPETRVWQFSKEYIAGKTTEDALNAALALNRNNTLVTLGILGEFVETMDQAKENRDQYIDLINTMEATDIKGNHSIKPTMFGLLPDKQTCSDYILDIMAAAAAHGNFVRIDMENSPTVDDTIAIFRRIKAEFPKNVGLVRQAYLKRTRSDIEAMLDLIEKYNIPKDRYEFQMLYGVTPKQRQSLADDGHKVRVYVPFGEHWFGYSTRRLKENPAMVTHIVTALFAKK